MNELFINEANELNFYCRAKGALVQPIELPEAFLKINDEMIPLTPEEKDMGIYTIVLDNELLTERYAEVYFSYKLTRFGSIVDKQKFEIARRIVSYDEVLGMIGQLDFDNYDELERTVRGIIEVFCKQNFNYWYGTRTCRGNDGQVLLPQYLESLEGISKKMASLDLYKISSTEDGYTISDDGLALENISSLEAMKSIHGKLRETDYAVRGQWGYTSVPIEVKQAAAALIQQKLCPDSVYRERYVDTIRNENMNVKYNPKTYAYSTGNADADKLLTKYRLQRIGVV